MHVEVVLPLIDGLLIKNWGRTDNSITCANIKCAALIIETLKLMSVSVGFFRFFFFKPLMLILNLGYVEFFV